MSDLIILCNGIPDDLRAVSSPYSPILPNDISAASRIAKGRAVGTNDRENWNRSSARMPALSPFPASSSIYIHRNCRSRIISTMKNVSTRGPMNDFMTNLSSAFNGFSNLDAKLLDFGKNTNYKLAGS